MLQRGIVKSINADNKTITVRVPMYETSNSGEALFECRIKNTPGVLGGYVKDDAVYVDFENDQLDAPVVVGKLFVGLAKEQNSKTSIFADDLTVAGTATFSDNFKVGDVNYKDLLALKKKLNIDENNHIYSHKIRVSDVGRDNGYAEIINSSAIAFTDETLARYLYANNATLSVTVYVANNGAVMTYYLRSTDGVTIPRTYSIISNSGIDYSHDMGYISITDDPQIIF